MENKRQLTPARIGIGIILLIAAGVFALIERGKSPQQQPQDDPPVIANDAPATPGETSNRTSPPDRTESSKPRRVAEKRTPTMQNEPESASGSNEGIIERAHAKKQSNLDVTIEATVHKTLPDDNEGSRHQKFIIRMPSGHTVLVAHNIDLAPYVPLRRGDTVRIRGEYEWSEQGGVLHWTHHDPAGRHFDGWIEHEGKIYK